MGKLDFFLHPQSIAVIGASAVEGKVGHHVMQNIINSGYQGEIYPINPKPGMILGKECFKSVCDVPGPIDVAVFCIPASITCIAAEECGKKGVKGIIVVAAGFREVGGKGVEYERELVDICKKYNVRCVGPNVLGNITTTVNMSFSAKTPMRGKVAMLSQSGAMMTAVLDWADTQKIGFSHFISMGNKCDVDEVDFVEEISDDPDTSILVLYLESVTNGKKFLDIVSKATKKKPIVILKSGVSPAGKEAASSHTGALAGDDIAFDLAFERCGVIRAKTMKELFDLSNLFDKVSLPLGDKFAILTNAGGPGIIAADSFALEKIEFAKFSEETQRKLRESLPAEASIKNPVDIVGDARPKRFGEALTAIFEESSDICAGALVLVTPQSTTDPVAVANVLAEVHKRFPSRLLMTTFMGGETMVVPRRIIESHGIPSYSFPEPAIRSLRSLLNYKKYIDNAKNETQNPAPRIDVDDARIDQIITNAKNEDRKMLFPSEASEILTMFEINLPKSKLAKSKEDIETICNELGFPLVLKIVSSDIQHKTDCGGVKLNVRTQSEAELAFLEILENVSKNGPANARIQGVDFQQMVDLSAYEKVTDMILGMTRDPQWGPMLAIGQGGIYANYLRDVTFELADGCYTEKTGYHQLQGTKVAQILDGVRGEKPSDVPKLVDAMTKMAQLARDHPNVREMDLNPLCVLPEGQGIIALDVKILI